MKNTIKKGNQVEVIYGKDKGKKGEVIEILRFKNRAKVKGINIVKKHEKTTKENFIDISNLKNLTEPKKDNKEKSKWSQDLKNNIKNQPF